jgi:hypothetical protein
MENARDRAFRFATQKVVMSPNGEYLLCLMAGERVSIVESEWLCLLFKINVRLKSSQVTLQFWKSIKERQVGGIC